MLVSAQALTVAMFGGVGTVWGPVIGSAILIPLAEILHAELGDVLPGIQGVVFGAGDHLRHPARAGGHVTGSCAIVAAQAARIQAGDAACDTPVAQRPRMQPAGAQRRPTRRDVDARGTRASRRSFGGLKAVQDVSFKLHEGEILGIIGPNGAGKTTLFNLLNGFLRPERGRGRCSTAATSSGASRTRSARLGIGRTFQVVRPFPRMSMLENVVVGAYVRAGTDAEARKLARRAIAPVGLSADRATVLAGELTTKELRLMELARALAGQPRILLLDETLAGLGHDEVDEVVAVIQRARARRHDHRHHRAHHAGDGAPGGPLRRARPRRRLAEGRRRR